jgi:hypothetical protein
MEWKWKIFSMDFIIGLPGIARKHNVIIVVAYKFSKMVHFIPIKSTFKAIDIVDVFIKEFFRLHGMPKNIISERDVNFTLNFWKLLFAIFGMQLAFNIAYHPQIDGHTKRVNRVL